MVKAKDVCKVICFNEEKVNAVKDAMLSDETINALAETFKVLGDETRTKILVALSKEELCLCDIAHVVSLSISAVSHQLRILRNLKLVKHRAQGRMAFYSLDDNHIVNLIGEGIEHVMEKGR